MVAGTTTMTAPQTRLLRKLEREGVMVLSCHVHQGKSDPRD